MRQPQAHEVAEDDRENQIERDQRPADEEQQHDQHGQGHVDADPQRVAAVHGVEVADPRA